MLAWLPLTQLYGKIVKCQISYRRRNPDGRHLRHDVARYYTKARPSNTKYGIVERSNSVPNSVADRCPVVALLSGYLGAVSHVMIMENDNSYHRVKWNSNAVDVVYPGDHIYVYRWLYTHHGIYIGNFEVVHFTFSCQEGSCGKRWVGDKSCAMVQATSLETFCGGSSPRLAVYGCSSRLYKGLSGPTAYYATSEPANEVVGTATYYLHHPDEWGRYDVETNNCNHFAYYCKTGEMLQQGGESLTRKIPIVGFYYNYTSTD